MRAARRVAAASSRAGSRLPKGFGLLRIVSCSSCDGFRRCIASSTSASAKAKGGGGGGGSAEKFDLTKDIPVNLKQGGEEPQYLDDSEYPAWLFELLEEDPTIEELKSRGPENLSYKELKRVIRAERRNKI